MAETYKAVLLALLLPVADAAAVVVAAAAADDEVVVVVGEADEDIVRAKISPLQNPGVTTEDVSFFQVLDPATRVGIRFLSLSRTHARTQTHKATTITTLGASFKESSSAACGRKMQPL